MLAHAMILRAALDAPGGRDPSSTDCKPVEEDGYPAVWRRQRWSSDADGCCTADGRQSGRLLNPVEVLAIDQYVAVDDHEWHPTTDGVWKFVAAIAKSVVGDEWQVFPVGVREQEVIGLGTRGSFENQPGLLQLGQLPGLVDFVLESGIRDEYWLKSQVDQRFAHQLDVLDAAFRIRLVMIRERDVRRIDHYCAG